MRLNVKQYARQLLGSQQVWRGARLTRLHEGGWGSSHYLGFPFLALCIVSLLCKEVLTQVAYQQAGMGFFTFPFEFVSPSFRFGPRGS